jgi:hypothetical protein
MKRQIFLLSEGEKLRVMGEKGYESEELLQRLLADYPDLLGGDQMDEESPRHWLLIAREVSVPGDESGTGQWHLDHLFVDQEGIPTLVEVKRASDTRIRREVVGQLLDYAANATKYWSPERILQDFQATCKARKRDSDEVLAEFLGGSGSPDEFWSRVKENLQAGKIRMLFVADEIPRELQRIVEFLNEQMDPAEVLAVEVKKFAEGNTQALVPRVIGRTSEAVARKQVVPGRQWDEATYFEALNADHPEAVAVAHRLLDWFRKYPVDDVWWGHGSTMGSFVPEAIQDGRKNQLCAVYTYGRIEMYFQWMTQKPPFAGQGGTEELREHAERLFQSKVSDEMLRRRPSIALKDFVSNDSFARLTDFFGWVIERIRQVQVQP